jgi:hypothetical protein
MLIFLHVLRAEALAVEEKLYTIKIGMRPDGDVLPFESRPIPMRENVPAILILSL